MAVSGRAHTAIDLFACNHHCAPLSSISGLTVIHERQRQACRADATVMYRQIGCPVQSVIKRPRFLTVRNRTFGQAYRHHGRLHLSSRNGYDVLSLSTRHSHCRWHDVRAVRLKRSKELETVRFWRLRWRFESGLLQHPGSLRTTLPPGLLSRARHIRPWHWYYGRECSEVGYDHAIPML